MGETSRHVMPPPQTASWSGGTAFLTAAPFTSYDVGQRSRMMFDPTEIGLQSSRTLSENGKPASPYLFRRSATVLEDLTSLKVSCIRRAKSASKIHDQPVVMPRSHMSVARFYDWSDDIGGCYSVSRLYREIAHIPRGFDAKVTLRESQPTISGVGVGWANGNSSSISCTSNSSQVKMADTNSSVIHAGSRPPRINQQQLFVCPGRMFVRDKKALTRGEREIIEGIYKNRSDVGCSPRDALSKVEFQVRSHQEAWRAGKGNFSGGAFGKAIKRGTAPGERRTADAAPRSTEKSDDTRHEGSDVCENLTKNNKIVSGVYPLLHSPNSEQAKSSNEFCYWSSEKTPVVPAISSSGELKYSQSTLDDAPREATQPQVQSSFWDSAPTAPPSTPNHLEPDILPVSLSNQQCPMCLNFSVKRQDVLDADRKSQDHVSGVTPVIVQNIKPNALTTDDTKENCSKPLSRSFAPENLGFKILNISNSSMEDYNVKSCEFHDLKPILSNKKRAEKKRVEVRVYLPKIGTEIHQEDANKM